MYSKRRVKGELMADQGNNYRIAARVTVENGVKQYHWDTESLMSVVDLCAPTLVRDEFKGRAYWFGYEFRPDSHPLDRRAFLEDIKGLGQNIIPEGYLRKFINAPLALLNKQINLATIDFFVYPVSGRSPLVNKMIEQIDEWTSHEVEGVSLELVKRPPSEIGFDWEKFDRRYAPTNNRGYDNRYHQMRTYVENELLPSIRAGEYFSLSKVVKMRYRPYIMNFLEFNKEQVKQYEQLRDAHGASVLVVDDVNTSGSTLNEILRMLGKLNPSLEVCAFTLVGRPEIG